MYWEVLGTTWELPVRSVKRFERLGQVLGTSWEEFGALWKGFRASWMRFGAILGASWRLLGRSLTLPGVIQDAFLKDFRIF